LVSTKNIDDIKDEFIAPWTFKAVEEFWSFHPISPYDHLCDRKEAEDLVNQLIRNNSFYGVFKGCGERMSLG